ncbi:HlyD family efflux transporter periplasmic adaptor subunit [Exiguobacterium sp. NG55]|uniref:HlyD family efflux transporter periplasmic adaptor subunit n=1 Tax=Exiguobacterium sp. NG55 TaxID=375477 RepID=UPI0004DEE387|nr:HlyD family efflux transporter periplasmic adaptor subunit [Exiguobacterium sp. NG55]
MSKIYSIEELTDSVELLEKKPPRFITFFLLFLLLILLIFLLWAFTGNLDVASKGTAFVQGQSGVGIVKSQVAGTIQEFKVKPGDKVEKGDVLLQIYNSDLKTQISQTNETIKKLEIQVDDLTLLKDNVETLNDNFPANVNQKIQDEYQSFISGYESIKKEKEYEITNVENSKQSSTEDEVLQNLITEKSNLQQELTYLKNKFTAGTDTDQINLIQLKVNDLTQRIQKRKQTVKLNQDKTDRSLDNLKEIKAQSLEKYQLDTINSINQRIESLEQEIFNKNQDAKALSVQNKATLIKSEKEGIVQYISPFEVGDFVEPQQELLSVIPTTKDKKVKILLPAKEMTNLKTGYKVNYSFNLEKSDKQSGKLIYIPENPVFDEQTNEYIYELEGTINTTEPLYVGSTGKVSIVNRKEPIWKYLLEKLN